MAESNKAFAIQMVNVMARTHTLDNTEILVSWLTQMLEKLPLQKEFYIILKKP